MKALRSATASRRSASTRPTKPKCKHRSASTLPTNIPEFKCNRRSASTLQRNVSTLSTDISESKCNHWSASTLQRDASTLSTDISESKCNHRYASTLQTYATDIPESKRRWIPQTGTYPQGFAVSGTYVGVKAGLGHHPAPIDPTTTKKDLALITSSRACAAAAVFTQNRVCAAPVQVSQETLRSGPSIQAIIINAGCANAVTGDVGYADAVAMKRRVQELYKKGQTLVMSTGVIGQRLPIKRILDGIPTALDSTASDHSSWLAAAQAICTTDTFPKLRSTTFTLPSAPDVTYSMAGMTKGAGMIHPNMATLLGVICTDVPVHQTIAQRALETAMSDSFNAISVDGDTSTNDTVALLANGAAGGPCITKHDSPDAQEFTKILRRFAQDLAHLVVRDGEGATKFVEIRVVNATSSALARQIASSIARSPLVKTALYGKDANWGRILAALGATNVENVADIRPELVSVQFLPVDSSTALPLLTNGAPVTFDEGRAAQILSAEDLVIEVSMGNGTERASYWTCDLSHEYIAINADYRT